MRGMTATPDAVLAYLGRASPQGRAAYGALRDLVLLHAPNASETLSYAMPTFVVDGSRLLHASAWKEHLSIYPLPDTDGLEPQAIAGLEAHRSGASTLRIRYDEPFPTALVDAVVRAHLARVAAGH
jgi:uncharacterized protein YdhG (YjbR/CyaY superfamily)